MVLKEIGAVFSTTNVFLMLDKRDTVKKLKRVTPKTGSQPYLKQEQI